MRREIGESEAGMSVLSYLRGRERMSTRTLRQLKCREDGICVNGERVTVRHILNCGDILDLAVEDRAEDSSESVIPRQLDVSIIYRDAFVTVCDKSAGMPTHPSHGHLDDTLANALAYQAVTRGEPFVFRPVNRLDGDTSGIVLIANDKLSSGRLFNEMKSGNIKKAYIAVVCGVPSPTEGEINAPIARAGEGILMRTVSDTGRPARTLYRTVSVSPDRKYSLIKLSPLTGRTHQIRVHMSHMGCPLVGDFLYGERSRLIDRHALHAYRLTFTHPENGRKMTVDAPLPGDMLTLCRVLGLENENYE